MVGGYTGHYLRVNLTTRKIVKDTFTPEFERKYVGGCGTAAQFLYDEVPTWADAFDPENRLIFSTGPVTGTIAPTAGRHTIVAKSPLTGLFGEANSGGFWGAELKKSGYDMIIFTGRSDKPVFLYVTEGTTEFRDASPYWGMDTCKSDSSIRGDLGEDKAKVATIGQGGENLVRISGIANDEGGRIAARCGLGAVMGFMQLKAVVVRGENEVKTSNPDALKEIVRASMMYFKTNKFAQSFSKGGTPELFPSAFFIGDTPAYNWSREDFGPGDSSVSKIVYPGGYEDILVGRRSCFTCPVGCRRIVSISENDRILKSKVEGPEYETLAAFGSNCGVDDIKAIATANDLCNLYGLDTISTGSTISFAMECYERGLITKDDLGGIELKFGNSEEMIMMVDMIAKREGFGNILAEGTRRAATIIGGNSEQYAMQVKGLELPMHDPRAFQGGGPHYACDPTGARHTSGLTLGIERGSPRPLLNHQPVKDRFSTEGKGLLAKTIEDMRSFEAASGWCLFALFNTYENKESMFVNTYSAVTGISLSLAEALIIGERIYNLKRAFSIRHGATSAEDTLPKRLLTEKTKAGVTVKLSDTLPEYYTARGWDNITGKPHHSTLARLELNDVSRDLWPEKTLISEKS